MIESKTNDITKEELKRIISMGENVNVEFKLANKGLPSNLFETICAFLNTKGGYIFLGISDDKKIIGIKGEEKEKIKKQFSTMCNNKEIINPTVVLNLNEIIIDDKLILYTFVKESGELHTCHKNVYIRNYEGDFNISNNFSLIATIHNQKRKIYDEDEIYPYISVENDLRHDLINESRRKANFKVNQEHPWVKMTDLELLKSANLYRVDTERGIEGVTLAGIMLFGKDEIIRNVNPYCRTDCIYRRFDLDRYDDRDFVETNLLDMYDRILVFIDKYIMDRFALSDDGRERISPASIMSREMVVNTLMHRDIRDGHTSRIIIYEDKMICENPNSFGTMKNLNLDNYIPFAKNPTLAKFFREIGYADELGSGIKKITKNSLIYSGKVPTFEDKEIFRLTIPLLHDEEIRYINGTVNGTQNGTVKISDIQRKIINEMEKNHDVTQSEISEITGIPISTLKRNVAELRDKIIIERIGSDKSGHWLVNYHLLKNNFEIYGSQNGTVNGTHNGTVKISEIQRKIINEMIKNHDITQSEISEITGIPISTLKRNIAELKNSKVLKRIGSDKSGYWLVNSQLVEN